MEQKFEDLRVKITDAINIKIKTGLLPKDKEGYILVDGYINMQLQNELNGSIIIGGPTIPTVAIVGKSSALIYTFALKALLPDVIL